MPAQYALLSAARINAVMQGLQDPRLIPQTLIWSQRIPDTPALDGEIMARFIGTIVMSDLIADDAKAAVYTHGRFQYEGHQPPNIKHGIGMNQEMLNHVNRLAQQLAGEGDMGIFTDWENRTLEAVRLGVQQRVEALLVAMLCDNLDYSRLGFKLSGATWGMPSDLKITVGTSWDNVNATPIADIWGAQLVASQRYGQTFNRVTMSTQAFRYMIATTEFQNKARAWIAPQLSSTITTNLPPQTDLEFWRGLAQKAIGFGFVIEIYDARAWEEMPSGLKVSRPYLPVTKVILSNSADDGNRNVWDFANGQVTEAIVAALGPVNMVGRLPANARGVVSYATLADAALNPPGIVYWGVKRGWPRKKLLQANACLTVGTFTDTITTAVPFTGT